MWFKWLGLPSNNVNSTVWCSPTLASQWHNIFVTHCCNCCDLPLHSSLWSWVRSKGTVIGWLVTRASISYTCANPGSYFLPSCRILEEKLKEQIKFIMCPFRGIQFRNSLWEWTGALFYLRGSRVMSCTRKIPGMLKRIHIELRSRLQAYIFSCSCLTVILHF